MARRHKLKRTLGIFLVTIYGLGNIVGAGIYALIGKVAGEAGMATPLAFLLSMLIASFSALSFAELSSLHPYSEGVSAYVHRAFKRKSVSIAVGLLMMVATIVSAATLARAFGGYVFSSTEIIMPIGSTLIILVLGFVASWGVKESLIFAAVHTLIEIAGLIAIIWFGKETLGVAFANPSAMIDIRAVGMTGLLSGAFLAFYAYIGIEDMVHLSEETKNPRFIMPMAIVSAMTIATVLYILIAIVATSTIPAEQLQASTAPLSLVFNKITNSPAWIITIIALTATAGGVLAHLISGSRLLYGMAEVGWVHKRLAMVHERRQTPSLAIIVMVIASSLLAIFFDLTTLAVTTSYLILIVFAIVNLSLIYWKVKHRRLQRPIFSVPLVVPILGLLFSMTLLATQTIDLFNLL